MKFILQIILFIFFCVNFSSAQDVANCDIKFMRLDIIVNPAEPFLNANTMISFKVDSCKNLPLLLELSDCLEVNNVSNGSEKLAFVHNNDLLYIYPFDFWNDTDSVSISYSGKPCSSGLGSVNFDNHNNQPIFWTLSQPWGARDWFPCKQVLDDKIDSVQVIVTCPSQYMAVSNGLLRSSRVIGNVRISEWFHAYPCAYYLVAVVVTNYKIYSDYAKLKNGDTIEISNYVYPECYEQWKRRTYKLTNFFKFMIELCGDYPFKNEKYSQVQFGWRGGVEHQTVSFLGVLDLDLMIHELAHQWFGNMLTCNSWQNIFLHEGFATYFEHIATEKGFAQGQNPMQWRKATINSVRKNPNSSIFVENCKNYNDIFDFNVSYSKGAMVLHTLRLEIGDEYFFEAIKRYCSSEALRYKNVEIQDFFDRVMEVTGKNYDWFQKQWIYGSGLPKYKVKWIQSYDNFLDINIEQTTTDSSTKFFRAKIPLLLHGENGEQMLVKLNFSHNNQHFVIATGFEVSEIEFDPYSDVLSINNEVVKQKTVGLSSLKIKYENSSDIRIINSDSIQINRCLLRPYKELSVKYNVIADDNHSVLINTSAITPGVYVLIVEGDRNCYSNIMNIPYKKKRRKSFNENTF